MKRLIAEWGCSGGDILVNSSHSRPATHPRTFGVPDRARQTPPWQSPPSVNRRDLYLIRSSPHRECPKLLVCPLPLGLFLVIGSSISSLPRPLFCFLAFSLIGQDIRGTWYDCDEGVYVFRSLLAGRAAGRYVHPKTSTTTHCSD